MRGSERRDGSVWVVVLLVGAVLVLSGLIIVVPTSLWPGHGEGGRRMSCLSNVKNLALALQMYLEDNGDVFPPETGWCDRLEEYVKNEVVFQCREATDLRCAFAYNSALSGMRLSDIADPAATVAIFESGVGWNAAGRQELLPAEPRHLTGDNYGFADGGAGCVKRRGLGRDDEGDLIWTKEPGSDEVRWEVEEDETPALSADGEDVLW